jgi:cell division transport system permease protein
VPIRKQIPMTRYITKALADIRSNRFLNLITIVTISLSILVVSLFLLFFENANRLIEGWNQGGRAMIYLEPTFSQEMLPDVKARIRGLGEVEEMRFIPKSQALEKLKDEMGSHTGFFDTLQHNPLPHALEIRMKTQGDYAQVAAFAKKIAALEMVESVEYGQGWLARFLQIFTLFRITGYAMCGLFLLIALFITANTVRLAFYSRRLEIEIMRLVGATEGFIKTPFYVEGLIQGFLGGILGLLILMAAFLAISSGISGNLSAYVYLDIRFLAIKTMGLIILASTFLGWFGCYLSLKQILK